MERLTKRIDHIVVFTQGQYEETTAAELRYSDIRVCLKKLAEYEDAEEQGMLIKPPLTIGTTVYGINCKGVAEYTVYAIIIDSLGIFLKIMPKKNEKLPHAVVIDHSWNIGQISEKLFLTREDAEARIKEVKQ